MFKKILIANRGEIALRILRSCREMGISTVAVHSQVDSGSMHVKLADESVCIGGNSPQNSYLNLSNILAAAEITNADAVHPGIGFLSENPRFAEAVTAHNMVFIGPSAEHLNIMGNKIMAKEYGASLGLPVVPGSEAALASLEEAKEMAESIGYPVMLKSVFGGGGKGMRIVRTPQDLEELYPLAQNEAKNSFGQGDLYMEKYLETPRHIEFQILGDQKGNIVCLGERDCSLQRNHQKVLEEAPSPSITEKERAYMIKQCIKAMKKMGYVGVGTLEFLYDKGEFYFIEMNTRLQVEHPVTEMITGIDLVKEQIKVAAGLPLEFTQSDIRWQGHAIECRINAEDPFTFTPQPGVVTHYLAPGGPGVRVDSCLHSNAAVSPYYDSLIAKLITHDTSREACFKKAQRALKEFIAVGPKTSIPLLTWLAHHPKVLGNEYDIHWLEKSLKEEYPLPTSE